MTALPAAEPFSRENKHNVAKQSFEFLPSGPIPHHRRTVVGRENPRGGAGADSPILGLLGRGELCPRPEALL